MFDKQNYKKTGNDRSLNIILKLFELLCRYINSSEDQASTWGHIFKFAAVAALKVALLLLLFGGIAWIFITAYGYFIKLPKIVSAL